MEATISHPTRNPQILSRLEGEGMVLMRDQDIVYVLNPTASTIWKNCSGQNSVDDIVELLLQEYEVDRETLARDVIEQLQFFYQENLILR